MFSLELQHSVIIKVKENQIYYQILILDMGFPLLHIRSQIMSWSSDSQVCRVWGQPIGHVEQSHDDILSDGISGGGRAMLPNCQADFTMMRREGG